MLNKCHIEEGLCPRAVISYEDTYSRDHFLIMQATKDDKMYTSSNFADCITAEIEKIHASSLGVEAGYQKKYLLTERLSKYLN